MNKTLVSILLLLQVISFQSKAQLWNKWYFNRPLIDTVRINTAEPYTWDPQHGGLVNGNLVWNPGYYLVRISPQGDTLWTSYTNLAGYDQTRVRSIARLTTGNYLIGSTSSTSGMPLHFYVRISLMDSNGTVLFSKTLADGFDAGADIRVVAGNAGEWVAMYRYDTLRSGTIGVNTYDSVVNMVITEKYNAAGNRLLGDTLVSAALYRYNNLPVVAAGLPDAIAAGYGFYEMLPQKDGGVLCAMHRDSSMLFVPYGTAGVQRTGIPKGGTWLRKLDANLGTVWTKDLQNALQLPATQFTRPERMFTTTDSGTVVICQAYDTTVNHAVANAVIKLSPSGQLTKTRVIPYPSSYFTDGVQSSNGKYLFYTRLLLSPGKYTTGITVLDTGFEFVIFDPWTIANTNTIGRLTANDIGGAFCPYTRYPPSTIWIFSTVLGTVNFDSTLNGFAALVSGSVVQDNNADCIYNTGDRPTANVPVVAYNPTTRDSSLFFTEEDGTYMGTVPPGTYFLRHTPSPRKRLVCPAVSYTAALSAGTSSSYSFYDTLIAGYDDRRVNITPCNFVPGFNSTFYLLISNNGNVTTTDTLRLIRPFGVTLVSASKAPVNVTGNVYTWVLTNLPPDSMVTISIACNTPASASIGAPVVFAASITNHGDAVPADNVDTFRTVVVGSFDPNDKLVNRPMLISAEQELIYRVDFQNTGNYPAKDVLVLDAIDPHLDLTTLKLLRASHGMPLLSHHDGNVLHFRFSDINLPDSVHNEPRSHGYFIYSIRPRIDAWIGDSIFNSASIIFDFNAAVETGRTANVIASDAMKISSPGGATDIFSCYPNPTSGRLTVQIAASAVLQLNDMQGRSLASYRTTKGRTNILLPGDLAPGIYMLQARADGGGVQTIRIVYQP
jgi:uncharacterized repeat protein (TIGR01451 family)